VKKSTTRCLCVGFIGPVKVGAGSHAQSTPRSQAPTSHEYPHPHHPCPPAAGASPQVQHPCSRLCRRLPSPCPYACSPPNSLSPPPMAHTLDGVTMLPERLHSSVHGSCSCASAQGFATAQVTVASAAGASGSSVSAQVTWGRGTACWAAALGFGFGFDFIIGRSVRCACMMNGG
jgi:hypothetical protein